MKLMKAFSVLKLSYDFYFREIVVYFDVEKNYDTRNKVHRG
jgi:hypothetical protein